MRAFALAGATTLALAVLTGTGLAFSLRDDRLTSSLAARGCSGAGGRGRRRLVRASRTPPSCSGFTHAAVLFGLHARPRRALAASLFVLLSGAEILWRNAASSLNAEPL
jgi:hypothetical protein